MSKKPFSIRVEPNVINRFRAIATVLNVDGSELLAELIGEKESNLSKNELEAYEALMRIWKE